MTARPKSTIRPRRAGTALLLAVSIGLVSTAGALLVGVEAAHGAGNSTLDRMILKDPEPGWQALTAAETQEFETDITNELSTQTGSTFATAVEGWQSPSGASTATLAIFIVQAVSGSVGSSASSQATDFCTGATNNTPTSAPAIPNVPDSAVTSCSGNNENVTVGTAITGNYLEFVASFGSSPLSTTQIEPVVSDQLSAIDAATSATTSTTSGTGSSGSSGTGATTASSSSSSIPIIAGAAGGVVVIAAIVVFLLMRRRKPGLALAGQVPAAHPGAPAPAHHGGSPGPYGHVPSHAPTPSAPAPSYAATPPPAPAPTGAGSHDPWDDSDPGWLSSHQAADSVPAPTGPSSGAGASVASPGAPGWYEDPTDKTSMRYWDGSNYTGRRRWDGSSWIDA